MFDVSVLLDRRRDHWVLAGMLWLLHAALQAAPESPFARALMTAHLGLFFLWQPLWQREQRLDRGAVVIILAFVATFVGTLNGGWLFAWVILLIGIVAGRARSVRRERLAYMLGLACLVSELLLGVVPLLFATGAVAPAVAEAFRFGLYVVPGAIALIPAATVARQTFPIDFLRGIIVALLTALLALGSVQLTQTRALDYATALFVSLLAVAAFLVFISWLVTPTAGTGLGALWEKSVLNIGTPFEAWMASLAARAADSPGPDSFLRAALTELVATPWIAGARWEDDEGAHLAGVETPRDTRLAAGDLAVTLYLNHAPGPTLLLHCRLLIDTLNHFHAAKRREQEQARQAHLQAIYATGARLTHDIKNLLQSLKLLATAATRAGREADSLELLQRQLPVIVQRLQSALDKLNQPTAEPGATAPIAAWWAQLIERHAAQAVAPTAHLDHPAREVPTDVLDSIVENLLDNVRQKAAGQPDVTLHLALDDRAGRLRISVGDTGAAIPEAIARQLFRQVVPSRDGLGVGLYQAAQLARHAGFELRLASNMPGDVRFELADMRPA
ncbi:MAG: ATP-binding protein [Gammaproteobacteria bacterium]